jgi:hypothetical protein
LAGRSGTTPINRAQRTTRCVWARVIPDIDVAIERVADDASAGDARGSGTRARLARAVQSRRGMRLGSIVVLSSLLAGGCFGSPVDGSWHLARTLREQPAGCWKIDAGDLDITVDDGATPPVTAGSRTNPDDNADTKVTADAVTFTTAELAFPETEHFGDTIIIAHDLRLDGDALVGTASARGDGENVACHYDWDVRGTRTQ